MERAKRVIREAIKAERRTQQLEATARLKREMDARAAKLKAQRADIDSSIKELTEFISLVEDQLD